MTLSHVVEIPVLGVPARFETNALQTIAVVERAYGDWRAVVSRPELVSPGLVRVRIIVESDYRETRDFGVHGRIRDPETLELRTAESLALADARRREAVAYVSARQLASAQFQHDVLDALTLFLVTRLDRQPLHAAGIVRDGAALLVAGPSGVGKSTLAYAALRAGYTLLSDDAVYIQLSPTLRVWGLARSVSLPPVARDQFPEVEQFATVRRADGRSKILIPLTGESARRTQFAERAGICVLERGAPTTLERLSAATAVAVLSTGLAPGFDRFSGSIGSAVERIARGGAWRLRVSGSCEGSLRYIDGMLAEVAATE